MAMRSVLSRGALTRFMETTRGATRYFSDGKDRNLHEEEPAAENRNSQENLREKLKNLKKKAEKEKAQKEKENAQKKSEGTH